MQVLLRFLGGLLIAAAGSLLVIKSEWFYQNFGSVPWAEEHLGMDGGSRLFYKLLGVIICLIGIAVATGMFGGLLVGLLNPLFGGRLAPQ